MNTNLIRFAVTALRAFCFLLPVSNFAEANGIATSIKASSESTLSSMIQTGIASHDSRSYWNCSIAGTPATKNLHVRFWRGGNGFSGHHSTIWRATSQDKILLTIEDQSFSLTDIGFNTAEHGASTLHAIDSTGAAVTCDWSGPLRGSSMGDLQFDEATSLLENQLISTAPNHWSCTVMDKDGVESTRTLSFSQAGIGNQDNDANFLWFVDERYNVQLSFERQVDVYRDFRFFSDRRKDDRFLAFSLADRIECRSQDS